MTTSAFALLALAAGCGGGGDGGEDRREVSRVVIEATNAAHAGNSAKACPLYTRAYVREVRRENRELNVSSDSCAGVVDARGRVLRRLTPAPNPRVTGVRVMGDRATARLDIDTHFGSAATKVFAVREEGRWKVDHDEDFPARPESPRP